MEDFGGNHSIALVTAVLISTKPASCSANCSSTPPAICCHPQKDVHSETSAVSPQSNTLWDVSQEQIHRRTMPWTGLWKQPQDFFPYTSAFNWYLFRAFFQSHPGLEKKSMKSLLWSHLSFLSRANNHKYNFFKKIILFQLKYLKWWVNNTLASEVL